MANTENKAPQRITPFLWFKDSAEEAIKFYTSVFKDSAIVNMHRLPADIGPGANMLTATFRIKGVEFMVLEGGPIFEFTPAISFFVHCETQEEVDHLWDKLTSDGGKESQCGWLEDKYGISWQIIPDILGRLMGDPDRVKAGRVMQAMLTMRKIDSAALQRAYDGSPL